MLDADDFVVTAESEQKLIKSLTDGRTEWRVKRKGMNANMNKTKVTVMRCLW